MSSRRLDALDETLAKLPKSVSPERDLWPEIEAQIQAERQLKPAPRGLASRWVQLAAAVLLVVGSSLVTVVVMRDVPDETRSVAQVEAPRPETIAMPASFAGYRLGEDYLKAREIADTLAEHPTDPLLHELLMSTYQSELQLLVDVTHMTPAPATRVQL